MTNNSAPPREDTIGTVVGIQAGCVVVRLDTGEEVLCPRLIDDCRQIRQRMAVGATRNQEEVNAMFGRTGES